jgi:hypothetical protein
MYICTNTHTHTHTYYTHTHTHNTLITHTCTHTPPKHPPTPFKGGKGFTSAVKPRSTPTMQPLCTYVRTHIHIHIHITHIHTHPYYTDDTHMYTHTPETPPNTLRGWERALPPPLPPFPTFARVRYTPSTPTIQPLHTYVRIHIHIHIHITHIHTPILH